MQTRKTAEQIERAVEPLVEELEDYRRQFKSIKADSADLIGGISEAQFNWRAAPGRWSIAQCLDHLNVTGAIYIPVLEGAITKGRALGLMGRGPFRHTRFGRWWINSIEPPVKLKVKAPRRFLPSPDLHFEKVTQTFIDLQERFIVLLTEANGLDLARIKVHSPATKLIRLTLGQGFALTTAHERRHLWQARQAQCDPNFPGS
jgi:DinB family protein